MSEEVGIGVVGVGLRGRTHLSAYLAARATRTPNRIVAICDPFDELAGMPAASRNLPGVNENSVRFFETADELIAAPDIDLISLCTHPALHAPLAMQAMRAGKHVLIEPPVALDTDAARALQDVAAESGMRCMPAMHMRFWPEWRWLRDQLTERRYGKAETVNLRRLRSAAAAPESPGPPVPALFTQQVHLADFAVWCWGTPSTVTSKGEPDHVVSNYAFDDEELLVTAEAGRTVLGDRPFLMSFTVKMTQATADFELGRDPQLQVVEWRKRMPVKVRRQDGFAAQATCMLRAILDPAEELPITLEEAVQTVRVLEAEHTSLQHERKVVL